jgi:hypothetical protein
MMLRVHGWVARGFDAVRDAFVVNFEHHADVGAACCVYRTVTSENTNLPWLGTSRMGGWSPIHTPTMSRTRRSPAVKRTLKMRRTMETPHRMQAVAPHREAGGMSRSLLNAGERRLG